MQGQQNVKKNVCMKLNKCKFGLVRIYYVQKLIKRFCCYFFYFS